MILGFSFLIACGGALNVLAWQASIGDIVNRRDVPLPLPSCGFNAVWTVSGTRRHRGCRFRASDGIRRDRTQLPGPSWHHMALQVEGWPLTSHASFDNDGDL